RSSRLLVLWRRSGPARRPTFEPVVSDLLVHIWNPIAKPRTTRIRRAGLWLAVALVGAISLASVLEAGEGVNGDARIPPPVLPGIGAHDSRVRLDPDGIPWRAVGKVQATSLNFRQTCTGTLVGPSAVLTAAHCVFNRLTQQNF